MLITEKMNVTRWIKNHLLLVVLFVSGSVTPFVAESQPLLSETRAKIMKNNAANSVKDYYEELNLIGNTNEDNSDREMYIESALRRVYDENVIVFNDLDSGGVSTFKIRAYLNTLQTRFHIDPGVQFKLEIKDTLGLYEAKENEMFAFTIVRVEREMTHIDSAGIEKLNRAALNFFLRFDFSDDRWNNEPKIYDIREDAPGIERRYDDFPLASDVQDQDETLHKTGTGELALWTNPAGCAIVLDGQRISDVTPYENSVSGGKMRIVLEKAGYFSIDTLIEISQGKQNILQVNLKPKKGVLIVETVPEGATVSVIGIEGYRSLSPLNKDLIVGEYSVMLSLKGYVTHEENVKVQLGKESRIAHTFKESKKEKVVVRRLKPKKEPNRVRSILLRSGYGSFFGGEENSFNWFHAGVGYRVVDNYFISCNVSHTFEDISPSDSVSNRFSELNLNLYQEVGNKIRGSAFIGYSLMRIEDRLPESKEDPDYISGLNVGLGINIDIRPWIGLFGEGRIVFSSSGFGALSGGLFFKL